MKRILILTVLMFGFLMFAGGQEVEIKNVESFTYAAMDFSGSFAQMEKNIGLFMAEFFKQNLMPAGPLLGIYYNDPTTAKEEEIKWAIGFPVVKEAVVNPPLKKVDTQFKQAAFYLYVGPYEETAKAYEKIMKFIDEKDYKMAWPTYERYLDNPDDVKPAELRTEIFIPVEKK